MTKVIIEARDNKHPPMLNMSDKGTHFFRCDLQVHTPRDLNWPGDECVSEAQRRSYAAQRVQACREHALQRG
jgi:hypothetical protein